MQVEKESNGVIENYTFESANEIFEYLMPWNNKNSLNGYIFRGHAKEEYELVPTALRYDYANKFWEICGGKPIDEQWKWESWQIKAEFNIIRDFYRTTDQNGLVVPLSERIRKNLAMNFDLISYFDFFHSEKWLPPDLYEVAALAQHYGIPTRLLDWTFDPMIALFFASHGDVANSKNMIIWCLNKEYVSFLHNTVNRINIEFIVPHYATNPNLNAQKGLFTHWPIETVPLTEEFHKLLIGKVKMTNRESIDELIVKNAKRDDNIVFIKKLIIPNNKAKKICKILTDLKYDFGTIFPGYQGVANEVLSRYRYRE